MINMLLRTLIIVSASFGCTVPTIASAERLFGHEVEIRGRFGEQSLFIDGRAVHKNGILGLREYAIVSGVGVTIGFSGTGGNACDVSPFVISFPKSSAPRFDGPIESCGASTKMVGTDSITFELKSLPGRQGETWTWTLESGLRSNGKIAFTPEREKGWSQLRERQIEFPTDLYKYAEIAAQIKATAGSGEPAFLDGFSGPSSGEFKSDSYVGTGCGAHRCMTVGSFIFADPQLKKVFLGWRTDDGHLLVRPSPVTQWPARARGEFELWAAHWKTQ
jgi:hypothetical protein